MHHAIASLLLILALVAAAGCAKKLSPQDVARMQADGYNSGTSKPYILSVQCQDGERGWAYICVERYALNPLHPDKYAHPMTQRVGWHGVMVYKGNLGGSNAVIAQDHEGNPGLSAERMDGPIPSPQELIELRKKQAAEVRRKAAD